MEIIAGNSLSHAHMWPHGLNRTDAFLSEHTTHSSICKGNISNGKTRTGFSFGNNSNYFCDFCAKVNKYALTPREARQGEANSDSSSNCQTYLLAHNSSDFSVWFAEKNAFAFVSGSGGEGSSTARKWQWRQTHGVCVSQMDQIGWTHHVPCSWTALVPCTWDISSLLASTVNRWQCARTVQTACLASCLSRPCTLLATPGLVWQDLLGPSLCMFPCYNSEENSKVSVCDMLLRLEKPWIFWICLLTIAFFVIENSHQKVSFTHLSRSLWYLARLLQRWGSGHKSKGDCPFLFLMFRSAPFAARKHAIDALDFLSAPGVPRPIRSYKVNSESQNNTSHSCAS